MQEITIPDSFSIESPSDLTEATTLLSELNKQRSRITLEKERITRPLLDALAVERNRWKLSENKIDDAISAIRASMTTYQTRIRALEQANSLALAKQLEDGTTDLTSALELLSTPTLTKVKTSSGSISFTTKKQYEVTDLAKVPRQYLTIDETRIRASMAQNKPIKGIRYYTEEIPINRR